METHRIHCACTALAELPCALINPVKSVHSRPHLFQEPILQHALMTHIMLTTYVKAAIASAELAQ